MFRNFILKELLPQVNKINLNIREGRTYSSKKFDSVDPVTKYDRLIEKN